MVEEETRPDPNSRPMIDVTDLYSALPGLSSEMSHHKLNGLLVNEVAALEHLMTKRGELVSEVHLRRLRLARDILGAASTKRIYDKWIDEGRKPTLDEVEALAKRPWFQDLRDQLRTPSMRAMLWITAILFGSVLLFNVLVILW